MKVEILVLDNQEEDDTKFDISFEDGLGLFVNIEDVNSFKDDIKDKAAFLEYVHRFEDSLLDDDEYEREMKKKIKFALENFDNIFDMSEYISLSFNRLSDYEFIKNNKEVLSKKIVLSDVLNITDYDKVVDLLDKYKDIKDKIYVRLIGNSEYISLQKCYETIKKIKDKSDKIKGMNMSPMENIMFIYNLLKNKVYKQEGKDDSLSKSRDLSDVLFGDDIVCLGYANIFQALIKYLDINGRIVELKDINNENVGHARNVIYVDDPKYKIDGVYYFDVTWDSKRGEDDKAYQYRYNFFARTKKFMDSCCSTLKDKNLNDASYKLYDNMKKSLEDGNLRKILEYLSSSNYILGLTGKDIVSDDEFSDIMSNTGNFDTEKFLSNLKDSISKFDREISGEKLVKIFNNVRKKEYYNGLASTYSLDDLYRAYRISNWKFKEEHISEEEKLLNVIFGDFVDKQNENDKFINFLKDAHLEKDPSRVEFTKVLRKIRDKNVKNGLK